MSEKTYAYYPGCTQHHTSKEYDVSARLICQALGIELKEIEDWSCCGASSAHLTSHLLSVALPARNLNLAAESKLPVTTPCPACFQRLKAASRAMEEETTRKEIENILEKPWKNTVTVEPLVGIIDPEKIKGLVKKLLTGLKVVSYYGCLIVRPHKIVEFDDEENPQSMDKLIKASGAEVIDWAWKTACCGASMPLARPDIVIDLTYKIIQAAEELGADCIAVLCPMCQGNLDMRQKEIMARHKDIKAIPVLYFTQLLGLAMGFNSKELMFDKHFVSPVPLLKSRGLV